MNLILLNLNTITSQRFIVTRFGTRNFVKAFYRADYFVVISVRNLTMTNIVALIRQAGDSI